MLSVYAQLFFETKIFALNLYNATTLYSHINDWKMQGTSNTGINILNS